MGVPHQVPEHRIYAVFKSPKLNGVQKTVGK